MDEGCGGGEIGDDGDEGDKAACVAVGEVFDPEVEVAFLGG